MIESLGTRGGGVPLDTFFSTLHTFPAFFDTGVCVHGRLSAYIIARLGRIEILCRSSLDRGDFLARYLCRRAVFCIHAVCFIRDGL